MGVERFLMPYPRPTLTQLRDQALQDIIAANIIAPNGNGISGLLQKAVLRVIAYVQAGFAYLHYLYLDWISLQSVPYTSTGEYLAGWGGLKGVSVVDATFAAGSIQFTVTQACDIPSGTPILRSSDGFAYASTADVPMSGAGTATVPIQATTSGAAGNCDEGIAFQLGGSIAGVAANGLSSTPIVGGSPQEDTDNFRTRVMDAYSSPPQGGDMEDYIEWALAVPGVTRAWVAPNAAGVGSVTVYVMLDEAEAAFGGFPQGSNGVATNETRASAATGDQLNVANHIFPLRPVTALVYVNAPVASPVNFTIANLGSNNTTPMQQAIEAALADMFVRLGNVGGTVNPLTGAAWPALDASAWYQALSAIPGLTQFTITAPAGPLTPSTGDLFTVGTCTFST
jgi:uncharacterized phage protein gp47/JayE